MGTLPRISMSLPLLYTVASVAAISALSLLGTLVLTYRSSFVSRAMTFLVSFSTGALLGTVFLHMLPEIMEHAGDPVVGSSLVLLGLLLAFGIEKFIHWHHCHVVEHDEPEGHHTHPIGPLILIGDTIHNFLDGLLIATAFSVNVPLGVATAVAIVLHEVPQELSDMALLLHSGMERRKAILWNTLSSCAAIVGAAVAVVFTNAVDGLEFFLLPIAAGNFLYIASTDLIPELHKETRIGKSFTQLALLLLGIALMAGLTAATHPGEGLHDDGETEHTEEHNDEEPAVRVHLMDADGNPLGDSMEVRVRTR